MDSNGITYQQTPKAWQEFIKEPMTYLDCRLFFGDPGQGKSISVVACCMDDCYQYVTHVVTPEGELIKANALNEAEQNYLENSGITYDNLRHMRIFNDEGTKSKIVRIPEDYYVLFPTKIFANRTLYGVRYVSFDLETFFRQINSPLYWNCWLLLSESVLLSKKNTTSYLGRFMEWYGVEGRKRHMRIAVDMQYKSQLLSLFHLLATSHVDCTYDEDTGEVNLDVNKSSPEMSSVTYNSKKYRKFYWSDEHMNVPQHMINRGLATIGVEKEDI